MRSKPFVYAGGEVLTERDVYVNFDNKFVKTEKGNEFFTKNWYLQLVQK